MRKILYDIKHTNANTEYINLDTSDSTFITTNIMSIICYMDELSLHTNNDIRDFNHWYNRSDKRYPYNKKCKKYNSPKSMLSGMLNSYMFGNQYDYSLPQLVVIVDIINTCIDVIDCIKNEYNLVLQETPVYQKIWLSENLWISQ